MLYPCSSAIHSFLFVPVTMPLPISLDCSPPCHPQVMLPLTARYPWHPWQSVSLASETSQVTLSMKVCVSLYLSCDLAHVTLIKDDRPCGPQMSQSNCPSQDPKYVIKPYQYQQKQLVVDTQLTEDTRKNLAGTKGPSWAQSKLLTHRIMS